MDQWWRICLQCRRCGFDSWVGMIPWTRIATYSNIVARKTLGTEEPGGYSPWGCKRVRYNCVTKQHIPDTILNSRDTERCVCAVAQSCLTLCAAWTVARWAPPSIQHPRQECWSGVPFPSPGDLPDPGIKFKFSALAGGFFTTGATLENPQKLINIKFLHLPSLQYSGRKKIELNSQLNIALSLRSLLGRRNVVVVLVGVEDHSTLKWLELIRKIRQSFPACDGWAEVSRMIMGIAWWGRERKELRAKG